MLGFSKKRFLITLGISVVVWVVSAIIQFFFKTDDSKLGFFILSSSCEVTGYPIAKCIPEQNKQLIYLTYFINIFFWFWVIHLFWSWFEKKRSS